MDAVLFGTLSQIDILIHILCIVDVLFIFREVADYFGKKEFPSPEQTRNEDNKLTQANQSTQ